MTGSETQATRSTRRRALQTAKALVSVVLVGILCSRMDAVGVQVLLAAFYLAIAISLGVPIGFTELVVIVPMSFLVQMLPVSLNGFGVREATFAFYFTRLGLPLESALLVSFTGAALVMLFSLGGGVAYLERRRRGIRMS